MNIALAIAHSTGYSSTPYSTGYIIAPTIIQTTASPGYCTGTVGCRRHFKIPATVPPTGYSAG